MATVRVEQMLHAWEEDDDAGHGWETGSSSEGDWESDVEMQGLLDGDIDGVSMGDPGSDSEAEAIAEETPGASFVSFMTVMLLARSITARDYCTAMNHAGAAGSRRPCPVAYWWPCWNMYAMALACLHCWSNITPPGAWGLRRTSPKNSS